MCTTKINNSNVPQKPKNGRPLDTLAELSHDHVQEPQNGHKKLIKRQIAKTITLGQLFPLIDQKSKLVKSYWNTYHCNKVIIQEGNKYTTTYCNNRWCTVCNRIRMAKMINAYSSQVMQFPDMQFVTLTAPNVPDLLLKDEIDRFLSRWRKIYKHLKNINRKLKRKGLKELDIRGIRKLECTYQPRTNTYNPHFHFIFSNSHLAKIVVRLWLKHTPQALRKAQDIRKADMKSILELFKYTVKGIHKGKLYPKALDTIYQAMYCRQTYSPIGIKKTVEEDIEGIKSEEITFKGYRDEIWQWSREHKDWFNGDGELLTGYIIEGKLANWVDELITSETTEPPQELTHIAIDKSQFKENKGDVWIEYVFYDEPSNAP